MALAMFFLVVGGTWQVVSRWILGNPSTSTDEILRYLLIWASMIGSAYCFYKNEHLSLDLIKKRLKGKSSFILYVFVEMSIIFFVTYVFIYGGTKISLNSFNSSAVLKIPYKVLFSILPISGVFIILARILQYVQSFYDYYMNKEDNKKW